MTGRRKPDPTIGEVMFLLTGLSLASGYVIASGGRVVGTFILAFVWIGGLYGILTGKVEGRRRRTLKEVFFKEN